MLESQNQPSYWREKGGGSRAALETSAGAAHSLRVKDWTFQSEPLEPPGTKISMWGRRRGWKKQLGCEVTSVWDCSGVPRCPGWDLPLLHPMPAPHPWQTPSISAAAFTFRYFWNLFLCILWGTIRKQAESGKAIFPCWVSGNCAGTQDIPNTSRYNKALNPTTVIQKKNTFCTRSLLAQFPLFYNKPPQLINLSQLKINFLTAGSEALHPSTPPVYFGWTLPEPEFHMSGSGGSSVAAFPLKSKCKACRNLRALPVPRGCAEPPWGCQYIFCWLSYGLWAPASIITNGATKHPNSPFSEVVRGLHHSS